MITLIAHENIPFKSHLTAEYFHLFQLGTKKATQVTNLQWKDTVCSSVEYGTFHPLM